MQCRGSDDSHWTCSRVEDLLFQHSQLHLGVTLRSHLHHHVQHRYLRADIRQGLSSDLHGSRGPGPGHPNIRRVCRCLSLDCLASRSIRPPCWLCHVWLSIHSRGLCYLGDSAFSGICIDAGALLGFYRNLQQSSYGLDLDLY